MVTWEIAKESFQSMTISCLTGISLPLNKDSLQLSSSLYFWLFSCAVAVVMDVAFGIYWRASAYGSFAVITAPVASTLGLYQCSSRPLVYKVTESSVGGACRKVLRNIAVSSLTLSSVQRASSSSISNEQSGHRTFPPLTEARRVVCNNSLKASSAWRYYCFFIICFSGYHWVALFSIEEAVEAILVLPVTAFLWSQPEYGCWRFSKGFLFCRCLNLLSPWTVRSEAADVGEGRFNESVSTFLPPRTS